MKSESTNDQVILEQIGSITDVVQISKKAKRKSLKKTRLFGRLRDFWQNRKEKLPDRKTKFVFQSSEFTYSNYAVSKMSVGGPR